VKVLITGGKGQLGRDCRTCMADTHQVQALSSRELDITDRQSVAWAFSTFAPDVVINCAAYTKVDLCEQEQKRCQAVNARGPAILADQCLKVGARLIHISTDYVFDGRRPAPQPYVEDDPTGPLSAYGRSKLAGEEAVLACLPDALVVRTAWLYGMGGPNFLKTILRLAVSDPGRTLKIVNDQVGSLTWTATLARQLHTLLDAELTGIVHATAEGTCTWYEGAVEFLQLMNVPVHLVPCASSEYPTPAHRPSNSILENKRLKEAGLNRMVSWREDLRGFVRRHGGELLRKAGE
jgi:dTDP-4-dehydrorhamnose reductase